MSEEAKVAEWIAFLFPFSWASLNRFVTGWLGPVISRREWECYDTEIYFNRPGKHYGL